MPRLIRKRPVLSAKELAQGLQVMITAIQYVDAGEEGRVTHGIYEQLTRFQERCAEIAAVNQEQDDAQTK